MVLYISLSVVNCQPTHKCSQVTCTCNIKWWLGHALI